MLHGQMLQGQMLHGQMLHGQMLHGQILHGQIGTGPLFDSQGWFYKLEMSSTVLEINANSVQLSCNLPNTLNPRNGYVTDI